MMVMNMVTWTVRWYPGNDEDCKDGDTMEMVEVMGLNLLMVSFPFWF